MQLWVDSWLRLYLMHHRDVLCKLLRKLVADKWTHIIKAAERRKLSWEKGEEERHLVGCNCKQYCDGDVDDDKLKFLAISNFE